MRAIDHINRYVSDVQKFINFYVDVLEYKLIDKGIKANGKNYTILMGDGHEMFISEREDFIVEAGHNFRHIDYSIEKIDELLERL